MIVELLDAANGDAAIVRHVGRGGVTVVGLVDGGPASTLKRSIAPALADHGITPESGGLDWVMVSHVDNDHIAGVLRLARAEYSVDRYYFNTPGEFPRVGVVPASATDHASRRETQLAGLLRSVPPAVVTASFREGQDLLGLVVTGGADRLNPPRNERLLAGQTVEVEGLKMGVLAPSQTRIDALLAEWAEVMATPASAEKMDTSVTNLSSLAVLVTDGHATVLFTGDALEDDIMDGLALLGHTLPMHVNVLKLPHHGSNSATNPVSLAAGRGLLENVTADTYVVSANGTSTNPSLETLERIVRSQERREAAAPTSGCAIVFPSPRRPATRKSARHYAAMLDALEVLRAASPARIEVVVGSGKGVVLDLSEPREQR